MLTEANSNTWRTNFQVALETENRDTSNDKQLGGTQLYMQHVNEKWLRLFNYYYILAMVVMGGLYVYFAINQQSLSVTGQDMYGMSIATGFFAVLGVLYNILILRYVKRTNIWLAYLLSFAFFSLTYNAAAEASLEHTSSYIFLLHNIIIAFAAATFGPIIALLVLAIVGVVFAMTVSGSTTPTLLGTAGDAATVAIRVIGVAALLVWLKDKYQTVGPTNRDNYIERYFVRNEVVKLLTDSIGDGIVIIDQKGNIKSINPGALQLLGKEEEDVLDLDYRSVLKFQTLAHETIQAEDELVAKAMKDLRPYSDELLMTVRDNEEIFVDITVSVIADKQKEDVYGSVIILRDVSKKKQEETARSEFISTASHEMRTPVAAIEGYLGLALNDKVSTIDSRARGYLEKAHASTEHLGRLFQDLLLSAKAEDGRLMSEPRVVEMGQFLEQLTESLRFVAEKKGLLMDFVIGASSQEQANPNNTQMIRPLYYTHVDPDRMREVITNIFDNAVKYTDTGKVTIGLTGNNEVVQLFVKDTGPGIPANDLSHLFQKFYRVDNSATRTIGGTGLGLFICRKIVELYKGRIWAESAVGSGSTFFINLPRLTNQKADELMKAEAAQEANTSPLDKTVAVVQ